MLLALSFARPYFAGAAAPDSAPLTVIAVDTSMSMTAPGQFDRARDAAARGRRRRAGVARAGARLAFADAATVVVEPTTDRSAIRPPSPRLGAERHAARDSGPRWRARAKSSARARATSSSSPTCSRPDGSRTTMAGCRMAWVSRSSACRRRRAISRSRPRSDAIAASWRRFRTTATSKCTTPVRLIAGGKEIAKTEVTVAASGAADVELLGTLPAGGNAEIRVDDATGYQADNARKRAARSDSGGSDCRRRRRSDRHPRAVSTSSAP